jgi:glycine/D-amino acid oxidase-like deaminating enzyme
MTKVKKTVVVVGAGIIGASIAHHLVKEGCAVTVVDAEGAGGIATRRSFAWINASWGNPEFYVRFRLRAMAEWRRLAADVPKVGVAFCGGLIWDLPPDRLEAFVVEHAGWGYGIRRVDGDGARAVEPALRDPPALALHVAEEAMVEPEVAAEALLAEAYLKPVLRRVTGLATRSGAVIGVKTAEGQILVDEVVLAAGAQTAELARTAGVEIAMEAPAGLIAHSTVLPTRILKGLVMSPELHVRQTRSGRLIIGSDFAGSDPGDRGQEIAEDLIAQTKAMLSGAEDVGLDFFTIGYRPTPADGFPVIGRPKAANGLYVAVMHSGVTLAPLVGLLAAREIATGNRDGDLSPFGPDRAPIKAA